MERSTHHRIHVFLIVLLGLCIFGAMNGLMLMHNPETWTSQRLGAWTAFHKDFVFSGFDQFTYIVVTKWRPLFELYRHPMLAIMLWPLTWINSMLSDYFHMNCAIYVIAVTYTLVSTATWCLLYAIFRRRIGLSRTSSLLLLLFYFGFAYVLLASFVPDHMIWTQFLLILTIYLASSEKGMKCWHALVIYFFAAGVTLTNGIKVWLMDMLAAYHSANYTKLFRRSLLYFIPTLLMGGIYLWHQESLLAKEESYRELMRQRAIERDSTAAMKKFARDSIYMAKRQGKQSVDSRFFAFTDNTVDRVQLVCENFFGEGFILHRDHLMEDANARKNIRPVIVHYKDWWNYIAEAGIVVLFAGGIWWGRRKRLLWLAMMPFLFDVCLHIGLRFAAADVYIMTAHWAYVIPIAIGLMLKESKKALLQKTVLMTLIVLTVFLWWHNLDLLVPYILP